MSDVDDIDLAVLPDEDLIKQIHDDLYDGLGEEIVEGTTILLDRKWTPDKVLQQALVEGMRIVGVDFRDGILFVPEVLLAANAMKAGMHILRPLLAQLPDPPTIRRRSRQSTRASMNSKTNLQIVECKGTEEQSVTSRATR
jgi:methanogenic corrinoid protein MtbC1